LDELVKNSKPLKSFSNTKVDNAKEHKQSSKCVNYAISSACSSLRSKSKRKASGDIEEFFSKKPMKKKKHTHADATQRTRGDQVTFHANNNNSNANISNASNESTNAKAPKKAKKPKPAPVADDSEDAKRFRVCYCLDTIDVLSCIYLFC
jgi:hypothetical protein